MRPFQISRPVLIEPVDHLLRRLDRASAALLQAREEFAVPHHVGSDRGKRLPGVGAVNFCLPNDVARVHPNLLTGFIPIYIAGFFPIVKFNFFGQPPEP